MKKKYNMLTDHYIAVYNDDSNVEIYKDERWELGDFAFFSFITALIASIPVIIVGSIVHEITNSDFYANISAISMAVLIIPFLAYFAILDNTEDVNSNACEEINKPDYINQDDWDNTIVSMISQANNDEKGRRWFTAKDNKKLNKMIKTANKNKKLDSVNKAIEQSNNGFDVYIDQKINNKSQIVQ